MPSASFSDLSDGVQKHYGIVYHHPGQADHPDAAHDNAKGHVEHYKAGKHTDDLRKTLPSNVISVSDNYNHLFEQPTLFYAVAISIAVLGHVDSLHVQCAWAFTIARIAHSLVQVTVNVVLVRFTLFAVAWTALSVMIVREFLALL